MYYVVCYDVNTETKEGRRRLRHVAKACEGYGQRAQKSVFEVSLNEVQYYRLITKLRGIINEEEDSLRSYRIMEPRQNYISSWGREMVRDLEKAVIL